MQDFWGDPLTAAGAQSADGKATYVQLNLAGNQGEARANESIAAVREIVSRTPRHRPGVHVYVTGATALIADQHNAGDKSLKIGHRAHAAGHLASACSSSTAPSVTVVLVLVMVILEVAAARGVVAALGHYDLIGLSTFSVNLLTMLGSRRAPTTRSSSSGRYHEARNAGEDRADRLLHDVPRHRPRHPRLGPDDRRRDVCLHFTRLPVFPDRWVFRWRSACTVAVLASLTMAPAIAGDRRPVRALRAQTSCAHAWLATGRHGRGPLAGADPGRGLRAGAGRAGRAARLQDQLQRPQVHAAQAFPAMQGFAVADRHFSQARMNPELLMVQTDHDLRNSADMLIIERIAKNVFHTPGIARVQTITRPLGTPIDHTSIPYQMGMQGVGQQMTRTTCRPRWTDMLVMANQMGTMITTMETMIAILIASSPASRITSLSRRNPMVTEVNELRDHIANFDDFFRPIRSYFYWEKHCFDIPRAGRCGRCSTPLTGSTRSATPSATWCRRWTNSTRSCRRC